MASDSPRAFRQAWRVFLDSNVIIAGLISSTGASAAIRNLGEAGEIRIVISPYVLVEIDRVIQAKFSAQFPHLIGQYRAFIQNAAPLLANDPPAAQVRKAKTVIDPGDAPILAAARLAQADYLVTLDIRHFHTPRVRAYLPIPILTPAGFLTTFRNFLENF